VSFSMYQNMSNAWSQRSVQTFGKIWNHF
jgi:hypothetical protein